MLYNQQLAGSIYNNVLLDNDRLFLQTRQVGPEKVCSLWCPVWTYRVVTNETLPLPLAKVVVTGDLNGDGVVDWQDGAIAYRPLEPLPLGAELVKKRITSQIAMNFASYAQHPFLRVLDSVKMMYLQTDGLGQEIQFKGYQAEGHDSSHPDYGGNVGRRQGGRDEFNFVMRRMKDFNATAGIHINATEYYPGGEALLAGPGEHQQARLGVAGPIVLHRPALRHRVRQALPAAGGDARRPAGAGLGLCGRLFRRGLGGLQAGHEDEQPAACRSTPSFPG